MANKKSKNNMELVLEALTPFETDEAIIIQRIDEVAEGYSFEKFLEDCTRFYLAYSNAQAHADDRSINKSMDRLSTRASRILWEHGHRPDAVSEQVPDVPQQADDSLFDLLTQVEQPIAKTAGSNVNQDDFYLQNNLAFGLNNNNPTNNVDPTSVDKVDLVEGKPKVTSCSVLNVKVASVALAANSDYISTIADLYNIGDKLIDVKFNRDKMICSLYYK